MNHIVLLKSNFNQNRYIYTRDILCTTVINSTDVFFSFLFFPPFSYIILTICIKNINIYRVLEIVIERSSNR